jgi:hypothetical protein
MTDSRILMRKPGSPWHSPVITAYANEDALQKLLEESPQLLPWSDASAVAVARELEVPLTGRADLVIVSTLGEITVVECKLRANPEIRRHIVGQLLAYASSISRMSYEALDLAFAARTGRPLIAMIGDIAADTGSDFDAEQFRAAVTSNLRAGRMGLLIAVDEITDELKGIVEFLNRHTDAELRILALELNLVADEGVEVLLPSVFGEETVRAKRTTTGQMTASTFIALVEQYAGPEGASGFQRLFEHAQSKGVRFSWGEGESTPSVSAWYDVEGQEMRVWSSYLYRATQRATFDINFEYLAQRGVTEGRLEGLISALEQIPGAAQRFAQVRPSGFRKRPSLGIDEYLSKQGTVDITLRALDELIAQRPAVPRH